jgi:hypothetical protein
LDEGVAFWWNDEGETHSLPLLSLFLFLSRSPLSFPSLLSLSLLPLSLIPLSLSPSLRPLLSLSLPLSLLPPSLSLSSPALYISLSLSLSSLSLSSLSLCPAGLFLR